MTETQTDWNEIRTQYREALSQPIRPPSKEEMAGLELRHIELRKFRNRARLDGDPELKDIESVLRLQKRMLVRLRLAFDRRMKREAKADGQES